MLFSFSSFVIATLSLVVAIIALMLGPNPKPASRIGFGIMALLLTLLFFLVGVFSIVSPSVGVLSQVPPNESTTRNAQPPPDNGHSNGDMGSLISYRERFSTSVGTGALSKAFFSDGMAQYSDEFLATNHGRIQSMNMLNTQTGCSRAQYASDRIWFGSTRVTKVSINGNVIGEYDSPAFRGKHGAIFDWLVSVGDMICVELSPGMEYHIAIGPDVDIHYDSYCYRGYCD